MGDVVSMKTSLRGSAPRRSTVTNYIGDRGASARGRFTAWYKRCFGAPLMSARSVVLMLLSVVTLSIALGGVARAQQIVPAATELPQTLSLDEALRIFRQRGLELLIAEANVRSEEGAVKIANAVPNPVASTSVGNAITYSTTNCLTAGAECSPWIYNVGVTDSAALEDTVSGKRALRVKVARNALAAAK